MHIYTHARSVRLRPQLEALEPTRRVERAKSFSSAVGLPPELVISYLKRRREEDEGADLGDELLFTGEAVKELDKAATKLGRSEEERLANLLKFRIAMARAATGRKGGTTGEASRSVRKKRS